MSLKKYIFVIVLIVGILCIIYPEIDIIISNFFYSQERRFFYSNDLWVQFVFNAVPVVAATLSIALVLGLIIKAFTLQNKKSLLKSPLFFLLITLCLGPGLVVNFALKENFGRARPSQIQEFGGVKEFSPALSLARQCQNNCSFSSGHAAMGFYFTAFSYIAPVPYQAPIFIASTIFGTIVGIGRIAQGGHFFSDVIFSFILIMIINEITFRIWKKLCKKAH